MSSLHMRKGNAEVFALADMSGPYARPLRELWPEVPCEVWEPYPNTFEGKIAESGKRLRIVGPSRHLRMQKLVERDE